MRQLVAFIGGLDLCDGRFDTSEHSLFHTLKTVHSEDYHQACYPGASIKQGGVCGYLSISVAMPCMSVAIPPQSLKNVTLLRKV